MPTLVASEIRYSRDVRPILAAKCFKCHGPDEATREADLRLDLREAAIDYGAISPHDADDSSLLQRVTTQDESLRMPPGGEALTKAEVDTLRQWINDGANYELHWAYVKPVRPIPPAVARNDWPRNSIDHSVLARLESCAWEPSPVAEPAMLLRRVYLDLIGLPPTVEDIEAFERDPSPETYLRAVDQLLDSKHYGEKWARLWLDLARYADTNGYQHDRTRTLWPYRDWVVNALNADMPFDQFTCEQLAGDLLPQPTTDQLIATGFHRCVAVNLAGGTVPDETRVNIAVDRVNTTGTVWLGSTLECAQCHTHKYDPFTIEDYYRLYAYFNQAADEVLVTGPHGTKKRLFGGLNPWTEYPSDAMTPAQIRSRVMELSPLMLEAEAIHLGQRDPPPGSDIDYGKRFKTLTRQLEQLRKQLDTLTPSILPVMAQADRMGETRVMLRGNYKTPGETVLPGVPASLHSLTEAGPADRLQLARWLVDRENPLTARVMVNRWWGEIFGRGIVTTTDDFGRQGALPTHPELLDWLAVEFMESGWSMKHIHRLIVTSATYQQSSDVQPSQFHRDPHNELLARGPRFRLSAEEIRDNALAVSGLLNRELGGPPVFPRQPDGLWEEVQIDEKDYPTSKGKDRYRRGLYVFWRRTSPYPSFLTFDAPNRSTCTTRRERTNTPLQALTLLNDPVFIEAAVHFAIQLARSSSCNTERERIEYAFRRTVARQPSTAETDVLLSLLSRKRDQSQNGSQAFEKLLEGFDVAPVEAATLAPWFFVAHTLLNLDEAITKR